MSYVVEMVDIEVGLVTEKVQVALEWPPTEHV